MTNVLKENMATLGWNSLLHSTSSTWNVLEAPELGTPYYKFFPDGIPL